MKKTNIKLANNEERQLKKSARTHTVRPETKQRLPQEIMDSDFAYDSIIDRYLVSHGFRCLYRISRDMWDAIGEMTDKRALIIGRDINKVSLKFSKMSRARNLKCADGEHDMVILTEGFMERQEDIENAKALLKPGGMLYTKAIYMKSWHFSDNYAYQHVKVVDEKSFHDIIGMQLVKRKTFAWSPDKVCLEEFLFRNQ